MLIIGLTGSIGMGKSTVAGHFKSFGIPICDADAEVHKLYEGAAVPQIEQAFPGVAEGGVIDRAKLAAALMKNPDGFENLEDIVHPMVRNVEKKFLQRHARDGAKMAVLEVPLLFETGGNKMVDVTVVVSTSAQKQQTRVLERSGMTIAKLEAIRERQMPDTNKRNLADFLVDTSGPMNVARDQVARIIETLSSRQPEAYALHWADGV